MGCNYLSNFFPSKAFLSALDNICVPKLITIIKSHIERVLDDVKSFLTLIISFIFSICCFIDNQTLPNTHQLRWYLFVSCHLTEGCECSKSYHAVICNWGEESSWCGIIQLHPVNMIVMNVELPLLCCLCTPSGAVGTSLLSYTPP